MHVFGYRHENLSIYTKIWVSTQKLEILDIYQKTWKFEYRRENLKLLLFTRKLGNLSIDAKTKKRIFFHLKNSFLENIFVDNQGSMIKTVTIITKTNIFHIFRKFSAEANKVGQ